MCLWVRQHRARMRESRFWMCEIFVRMCASAYFCAYLSMLMLSAVGMCQHNFTRSGNCRFFTAQTHAAYIVYSRQRIRHIHSGIEYTYMCTPQCAPIPSPIPAKQASCIYILHCIASFADYSRLMGFTIQSPFLPNRAICSSPPQPIFSTQSTLVAFGAPRLHNVPTHAEKKCVFVCMCFVKRKYIRIRGKLKQKICVMWEYKQKTSARRSTPRHSFNIFHVCFISCYKSIKTVNFV